MVELSRREADRMVSEGVPCECCDGPASHVEEHDDGDCYVVCDECRTCPFCDESGVCCECSDNA